MLNFPSYALKCLNTIKENGFEAAVYAMRSSEENTTMLILQQTLRRIKSFQFSSTLYPQA